jgi:hypothetical protein
MNRKLEARIEGLRQLRSAGSSEDAVGALRKALQDRGNRIIAEAAKTIAALHLTSLIPNLLAAFDALSDNPAKTDPKPGGRQRL